MASNSWTFNNKCASRNYEKLRAEYNILLENSNSLKSKIQCLQDVNEHNSTKIRQMNTSFLNEVKRHVIKEDHYLKQIELLKESVCFDNVCEATAPVVPETCLQERTNIVDATMTELVQLHKQIFNNPKINQWAENCNKLETQILTRIKEDIFYFVVHLIGQLQEKSDIINNIVNGTENIRYKLVDATNNSIEKDNKIKEIIKETSQLKTEDEKPCVEIMEWVKNCNKELNYTREEVQELKSRFTEKTILVNDYENYSIEKDNKIKKIISETSQLKNEDEKTHVEIKEWVKNCNKELNCTREEVKELKSRLTEKTILVNDFEKRIALSIIKYEEINTELDTVLDNNNLLTQKVKDYDITNQNNDVLIKDLKNEISSTAEILKTQCAEISERKNDITQRDALLKKYKDTILDLEFEIKNHKELHNKLQINYGKLQDKNEELNVKCSEQNKIIVNHDKITNDFNVKIISLEKMSRDKDSKIAEIIRKVTERDNELCECVEQKNYLQSALAILTKSHSKLSTEFNEVKDKHQKLKTQFDEQTETIKSNNNNEKCLQEALIAVNKLSKEKDAELERSNQKISQLTQQFIDSNIKKNVVSSTQSNNELLQLYNIVNSSIESKAMRTRQNRVSKIMTDSENDNINIKSSQVGKDAEIEKEKSEENPNNLIKERKQSSKPSKIPLRRKAKHSEDILATSSMVYNQIKISLQYCPPNPRKPIKKTNDLGRKMGV